METDILFRQKKDSVKQFSAGHYNSTTPLRKWLFYKELKRHYYAKRWKAGSHCGAYELETTGRDGLGTSGHTWHSSSLLLWPYIHGRLEHQSLWSTSVSSAICELRIPQNDLGRRFFLVALNRQPMWDSQDMHAAIVHEYLHGKKKFLLKLQVALSNLIS